MKVGVVTLYKCSTKIFPTRCSPQFSSFCSFYLLDISLVISPLFFQLLLNWENRSSHGIAGRRVSRAPPPQIYAILETPE